MAISLSNNLGGNGVPPGLPGSPLASTTNGGSQNALNADNGDWENYLQPTSLSIVGDGKVVSFPCLLMQERQSNSIATHTYPNLDSGYQENMGRNPAIFHVKIALTNNIYPNTTEQWTPGVLFPNTFENLLNLLLNTSTDKTFNHPIYGATTVQVSSWEYDLNAKGPRDGVFLDVVLLETIGQNNPLSQQISTPASSKLQSAANALDNAVVNPPGLSLSGFFTQIQQTIGSVVSIPNNLVNSLNANIILPVLNGSAAVEGSLYTAPATVYNNLKYQYQLTKTAVLNATANQVNTNSQDPSVQQVYSAFITLNNQPSQNASQLIGKALIACAALETYYINQNLSSLSSAIEALRAFSLQLQQTQSALSFNASNQSLQVQIFVTNNAITWQSLAKVLNNSVDQLMGLNTSLVNSFIIPTQTPVSFYRSST